MKQDERSSPTDNISSQSFENNRSSQFNLNISPSNQPQPINLFDDQNCTCLYNNEGTFYCADKSCDNHAIYCFEKLCPCQKNHKDCETSHRVRVINKKIQGKLIANNFSKKIDNITAQMEELISTMQQSLEKQMRLFGLNEGQKKFRENLLQDSELIKKGQKAAYKLTGKSVDSYWAKSKMGKMEWFREQTNFMEGIISSTQSAIKNKFLQLTKETIDEFRKNMKTNMTLESSILKGEDQYAKIYEFTKELNGLSAKLVFRGTVDGMSMRQFHSKCDNKPNLLYLVENEFGFKYGGYTPCCTSIDRQQSYAADNSLSSFIFSLDVNKKARIIQRQTAIIHGDSCHLISFGTRNPCSLVIGANSFTKNELNWVSFNRSGSSYQNVQGSPSWFDTNGTQSKECKLREVEVFQLFLD